MKKTMFFKLVSLLLSVAVLLFAFVSCGNKETAKKDDAAQHIPTEEEYLKESPLTHKDMDKRPEPDVSKTEVMEATKDKYFAQSEEDFVKALEKFANPKGNKFDALAVLGDFSYDEKEEDLLKRFEEATDSWHATVIEEVGDKCTVEMILKEKTAVDLSDSRVVDWKTINGIECEGFSNIKCTIATNYAKDAVTLSLDIVKVNGNWHFATIDYIDKVLKAITTDIY